MRRLNINTIFQSNELSKGLAQKSFQGGMSTMSAKVIQFILSTAGTIVLARLLTPTDYGLIGMAMVVIAFARMFMDAGLSLATVQKSYISHEQISTLFWVNFIISLFLCLCVLSSSQLIARFYGHPELVAVTAVLSLVFLIIGLTIQHEALLRRHMQFGTLAVIDVVSGFITLCITIVLALFGWQYWALVGSTLVTALTRTLMIFIVLPWIPGRMKRNTGVRSMLKFGGNLTTASFVTYLSSNLDKILIGKFIGADALGLYSKADRLLTLPIREIRMPMTNVAIPSLSALKEQPNRYIKYYQRFLDLLATVTIPLTLYCAIEADFLIHLLLGPQWMGVVPVFRVLAIAGIILPVAGTQGIVLLSFGFSDKYLNYWLANSAIMIVAIFAGLPFGITGIAIGYVFASYAILIPSMFYCFHNTPVTVTLFLKTLIPPILTSGLAASFVIFIRILNLNDSTAFHFMLLGVFSVIYTGVSCSRQSIRETLVMLLGNLSVKSHSKEAS